MKKTILAILLLAILPAQAQALSTNDLLSLVAMPLAVAAVSEITGVPANELSDFVATLNNANVPPTQFIEVLRYVPVALVYDSTQPQPVFVDYVRTQVDQGVTGPALVPIIVERLRTYDVQPEVITITQPQVVRTIVVDRTYVPVVVLTRVDEIRKHPHGGPPGQLKKTRGVQTGAEIVHGDKKSRQFVQPVSAPPPPPMTSSTPKALPPGQAKKIDGGKEHGKGKDKGHEKH
jgi:hypothetical protein